MNVFSVMEAAWWAAVPLAVVLGVVLGGSPLAWPVTVVALSTSAAQDERGRFRGAPLLWVGAGLTLVYVVLGAFVGMVDVLLRDLFGAVGGVLYVLLAAGSLVLGALLLSRPEVACRTRKAHPRSTGSGALVLGVTLGVVNCPSCAGVITGVALAGAAVGGVAVAMAVMAALGAGQTLAMLLLGRLASGILGAVQSTTAHRIAAVGLLLVGAFFVFQAVAGGVTVAATLP